ncbi:methyltransferase [Candidatus Aerophobetes bacterium]|nr:methyltransferase [Candidatus Aerophobetes bacterium]
MKRNRLRAIVCGSTFGQFYLEALRRLPEQFELVGLLARGSERSKKCAEYYGINLYADIDQLPGDIDLACVAVRSTVLGGKGTDLSLKLLSRGVHTIQELPVSEKEIISCLRIAQQNKRYFWIANLYNHLPSVQRFIACIQAMLEQQNALYVDVSCSIHVTYPIIHILLEILPSAHLWKISGVAKSKGPFQVVTGEIGDTPVILRVHNEIDPENPNNYIHLLFSITVGVEDGRLVLVDTHGPVFWHPSLYPPLEKLASEILTEAENPAHLSKNTTEVLGPMPSLSCGDVLLKQWPCAIGHNLLTMRKGILEGISDNAVMQRELRCSHLWQSLTDSLGYPLLRPVCKHSPLSANFLKEIALSIPEYSEERSDQTIRMKSEEDVFTCTEIAEDELEGVDANLIKEFVKRIDEAVLFSMLFALQFQGTLINPRHEYSKSEILSTANVAPRHHNLILRWLRILTERGYIRQCGESFLGTDPLTLDMVRWRWNLVKGFSNVNKLTSPLCIDYLVSHVEQLPQLMSGRQQPVLLLFPEGRTDIANALYRDTITARYLNKSVAEVVVRIADRRDSLRILEVGAGTGATTNVVVHRLNTSISKQIKLDYLFTDISKFFLAAAREHFKDCSWMRFQIVDIDKNLFEQGLKPESVDIVIAAGVLNNARDINKTVRGLMQILTPGGWMLITEPTREMLEILISQAFMMTPPEDDRKNTNTTFLSTEQWLKVFYQAGAEKAVALPSDEHILAPLGQKLFIVKKPGGRHVKR